MQTIPKEDLDARLGTLNAVFPQQLPGALRYHYGLLAVDATHDSTATTHLRLNLRPAGVELYLRNHETVLRLGVPFEDITAVELKLASLLVNPLHPSVLRRVLGRKLHGHTQDQLVRFAQKASAVLTLVVVQDGVESFVVASVASGANIPAMQKFLFERLANVYRM